MATVQEHCLGCGVCALKCPTGAITLQPRAQKVYHPEDSFERVMLQALERDTFQTFLFDNPESRTQEFMRALVGGFLKLPPVKRALLSDKLRSRFLSALRKFGT
jgi:ferredoxin